MSAHPELIRCTCPADPAGPPCQVPHDRWIKAGTPLAKPLPCLCDRRGCSPQWCECAGRVDLENVPPSCCAWKNTPEVVAKAIHGGDYRTCWCKGDIEKHKTQAPVITALPGFAEEEDDDAED